MVTHARTYATHARKLGRFTRVSFRSERWRRLNFGLGLGDLDFNGSEIECFRALSWIQRDGIGRAGSCVC